MRGGSVVAEEEGFDVGHVLDLGRVDALVGGVDEAPRFLDAHEDDLGVRELFGEDVAQRDGAALPEVRHGRAVDLGHGPVEGRVRGPVGGRVERGTGAFGLDGDLGTPGSGRAEVGGQRGHGGPCVGSGRHAQRDAGTGGRRDGRGGTDDGRAVDAEDRDRRTGPEAVGHAVGAGEPDLVEDAGVGAELLLVVADSVPDTPAVQAVDAGGTGLGIAQGRERLDERGEGVGGGAAEHAGVDLALEGLHGDDDVRQPAQGDGRGTGADAGVARVADQECVGAELLGVPGDVLFEAPRALLLGTLGDEPDPDGEAVAEGAQGGEVHDDVALAVGCAAAVPAAVALGQPEGRGTPGGVVERGLYVVMAVEEHGRRSGRRRAVAEYRLAAVRGLHETYVLEAGVGEGVRDPPGGPAALLGRVLAGVGDGGDGDEFRQVVVGTGHQGGDAGSEFCVRHGGSLSVVRSCRS